MDETTFRFEIVTPFDVQPERRVSSVNLPGLAGRFGVLAGHAPYVAAIVPGVVLVEETAGRKDVWRVGKGFAVVAPDAVSLVVRDARRPEELPESDGAAARDEADKLMQVLHG